jgi:hypothetical protein
MYLARAAILIMRRYRNRVVAAPIGIDMTLREETQRDHAVAPLKGERVLRPSRINSVDGDGPARDVQRRD